MRQADLIAQLRGRVRNLRGVLGGIDLTGTVLGTGSGTGTGTGTGAGAGIGAGPVPASGPGLGGGGDTGEKGDEEVVYRALSEGPPDIVGLVVGMLRGGALVQDIARLVRENPSVEL